MVREAESILKDMWGDRCDKLQFTERERLRASLHRIQ